MDLMELERFVRILWLVLAISAGLGVITMAVVQLIKDLLPIRTMWQRNWIQSIVAEQIQQPSAARADGRNVLQDLVNLAVGGNSKALYGLPINQLAGQLNAASQVVLDFPARHSDLFRVLAAGADPNDTATLLGPPPRARTLAVGAQPASAEEQEQLTRFVDARNRVAHHVQRNLDALQIAMSFRWQLYLQLVSIGVSILVAAATVALLFPSSHDSAAVWGMVVVVGVLGGFLSTVARDLAVFLQSLRRRS